MSEKLKLARGSGDMYTNYVTVTLLIPAMTLTLMYTAYVSSKGSLGMLR